MTTTIGLDYLVQYITSLVENVTSDKGYPCKTRWQLCILQGYLILVIESTEPEVETYVRFLLNKNLMEETGYQVSSRYVISPGIEPDYGVAGWEVFGQLVTVSDMQLPCRNSKRRGFSDWPEFAAYASYGILQIESDWEVHVCNAVPAFTESATKTERLGIGVDSLKKWMKKTSQSISSRFTTGSPDDTGMN